MGPPTLIRKHLFGCCQQRKTKHFLPKKPIQGNSWCSLKKLFFGCHLKAVDFLVESSLDYLGSAFSLTNFRSLLLCSGLSIRGCIRERNTYWIILPRNKRQYGQYLALKRPYLLSAIYFLLKQIYCCSMTSMSFRNHSAQLEGNSSFMQ